MTLPAVEAASAGPEAASDPRPLRVRLLRPTLPELWLFLAVALPVLAALVAPLPTVDLAYQLRAGAAILETGRVPAADTWTFTAAGQPWLDQQWGAQVVLAAVFQATGWAGLAIARAALVGLTFGLLLVAIRRRGPGLGPRTAAALTLAAFLVAAPALALRPQLLGLGCFAATLAILAAGRRGGRVVWAVPVIAALWANAHGSFVLAPVLVGLAWLEDVEGRDRKMAIRTGIVGLATVAATFVTPFGVEAWRYAAGLATNREVTARISEWQPTTPTDLPGILFWLSVLGAVAAVVVSWRRGARPGMATLVGLVAFVVLGAVAARGIAWWALFAAVAVASISARSRVTGAVPARPLRGRALNGYVGVALVLAAVFALPTWRPVDPAIGAPVGTLTFAPPAITATLRDLARPDDRVWNAQAWGSWLELAVPAPRYALDSRIEVIPPEAWTDGDRIVNVEPGWDAILDARGVTVVVADGGPAARLATALANHDDWRLVASEREGTLWVRADR